MDELDRIDRSIDIDATAEKVWGLVSRPGWWINSRTIVSNQDVRRRPDADGRVALVHDPVHGTTPVAVERLDPPTYAAFRWLMTTEEGERPGTLVEFFVSERPGGVTLRVVESGFSSLHEERSDWLKAREGNVEGWGIELEAFRAHFDTETITRAVRVPAPVDDVRRAASWPGATVEVTAEGDVALVVLRAAGFDDLEIAEARWEAELAALVARYETSVPA